MEEELQQNDGGDADEDDILMENFKDPRAGKIDVTLPQIQLDYARLSDDLLKVGSAKNVQNRRRDCLYKLSKHFKELANDSYPLAPDMSAEENLIPKVKVKQVAVRRAREDLQGEEQIREEREAYKKMLKLKSKGLMPYAEEDGSSADDVDNNDKDEEELDDKSEETETKMAISTVSKKTKKKSKKRKERKRKPSLGDENLDQCELAKVQPEMASPPKKKSKKKNEAVAASPPPLTNPKPPAGESPKAPKSEKPSKKKKKKSKAPTAEPFETALLHNDSETQKTKKKSKKRNESTGSTFETPAWDDDTELINISTPSTPQSKKK